MNATTFEDLTNLLNELATAIANMKRPDYTQESVDVLQNFKDAADAAGITPAQAWLVYFQKQFAAVARHIKNPRSRPSEPIAQRFADLKNYIDLGFAIFMSDDTTARISDIQEMINQYDPNRSKRSA